MPPRNAGRSLFSEESLSARIAYERERRSWTYDGLAQRMADVGCPINQSALFKIEKGTKRSDGSAGPPRRITVDELVALSRVFEVSIEELLLPPDLAQYRMLVDVLEEYAASKERVTAAEREALLAERRWLEACREWPDAAEALGDYLAEEWAPNPRSSSELPPGGPDAWLKRLLARRLGPAGDQDRG